MHLKGTDIAFKGIAGLADHQIGKLIFFDQKFILKKMDITIYPDHAIAKTEAIWQARYREINAPYSQLLKGFVKHRWKAIRHDKSQQALLIDQICEKFYYLPGFSPRAQAQEFHLRRK